VLEASGKPRSYWIHVKSIGNCEELQLYTLGILRYSGAKTNTLIDPGYMANPGGKVRIVHWMFTWNFNARHGNINNYVLFLFKRALTIKHSFRTITAQ
jgi:hypothetical protein